MYIVQGESAIEHVHCAMCSVQFGEWKLQCILLLRNIIQCGHSAVQWGSPQGRKTMLWANIVFAKHLPPLSHSSKKGRGKVKGRTFQEKWGCHACSCWFIFSFKYINWLLVWLLVWVLLFSSICVWCRAGIHRKGFSITTPLAVPHYRPLPLHHCPNLP